MHRMNLACAVCLLSLLPSPGLGQDSAKHGATSAWTSRREANAAYKRKEFATCARLFEQAAASTKAGEVANDCYNAACCYARAENPEKAFEMLRRSIKAGYRRLNHIKGDSDLVSLRADSRWEQLLGTIVVPPIQITRNVTTDPAKASFVYEDVHNFRHAMARIAAGDDAMETLQAEYFGKASPGLRQFVEKYGLTADALAESLEKRPGQYELIGERLAQLEAREASIREFFVRFKEVVPLAVFPPTYFLVADYSGIASGSPEGQLITLERRTRASIERVETVIVHELAHFQQLVLTGPPAFYSVFGDKKSLLALTIREGAAEFIADRVTNRITQEDARDYVLEHEADVWNRFQAEREGSDTSGWMWSRPSDPSQPRDVAYALGSRIVQAFYDQAENKAEAIREVLSVTDYPRFLERSGYASQFSSHSASPATR